MMQPSNGLAAGFAAAFFRGGILMVMWSEVWNDDSWDEE
jgi:hypothetical protein